MITLKKLSIAAIVMGIILQACAGVNSNIDSGRKISNSYQHTMVFSFKDPYYKGSKLTGIGTSFATAFMSEILAHGRSCDFSQSDEISASNNNSICEYALKNGADLAITGVVTEWLDGATQWSGKVDVGAVTVYAYDTRSCKLIASASAREKGQWLTFINSPATRFYKTLSKEIVTKLFE